MVNTMCVWLVYDVSPHAEALLNAYWTWWWCPLSCWLLNCQPFLLNPHFTYLAHWYLFLLVLHVSKSWKNIAVRIIISIPAHYFSLHACASFQHRLRHHARCKNTRVILVTACLLTAVQTNFAFHIWGSLLKLTRGCLHRNQGLFFSGWNVRQSN